MRNTIYSLHLDKMKKLKKEYSKLPTSLPFESCEKLSTKIRSLPKVTLTLIFMHKIPWLYKLAFNQINRINNQNRLNFFNKYNL